MSVTLHLGCGKVQDRKRGQTTNKRPWALFWNAAGETMFVSVGVGQTQVHLNNGTDIDKYNSDKIAIAVVPKGKIDAVELIIAQATDQFLETLKKKDECDTSDWAKSCLVKLQERMKGIVEPNLEISNDKKDRIVIFINERCWHGSS